MTNIKYTGHCTTLSSLRTMVDERHVQESIDVELTISGTGITIRSELVPVTDMTISAVQGLFFAHQRFIGIVCTNHVLRTFSFYLFQTNDFDSSFNYIEDQCSSVPEECFREFFRNESLEFYGNADLRVFLENSATE